MTIHSVNEVPLDSSLRDAGSNVNKLASASSENEARSKTGNKEPLKEGDVVILGATTNQLETYSPRTVVENTTTGGNDGGDGSGEPHDPIGDPPPTDPPDEP